MTELNTFQKYFVEEFYDDYREGLISRRAFIRRVAYITGSMTATVATMSLLGCSPAELPAPTEAIPPATPAATSGAAAAPTPSAPKSPLSVPADSPDIIANSVTFASQGVDITGYLTRPKADGKYRAVLVCHENRGMTAHIQDVTRRFAKAGYVALSIDLLSREGGTATLDRDEIPALLSGAPAERHVGDFASGLAYLQGLDYVEKERIGMTGYCFGGGITWRSAVALPQLKAAVPFYGPAPDLAQVGNIKAAVMGVYAEQDERITGGMAPLEQALIAAKITHEMKVYAGVNHAFHNDTGERYNEAQATKAWQDTLAWFDKYL